MWHRIPSVTEHINVPSVTELILCHHLEGRWDCVWAYAYTSINDDITCHDCIIHVCVYIFLHQPWQIYFVTLIVFYIHPNVFNAIMKRYIIVYTRICICPYAIPSTFQMVAYDQSSNWWHIDMFSNGRYSVPHIMLPEIILWKMKNNNRWNVTQCVLYTYKRVLNEHDMLPYNL